MCHLHVLKLNAPRAMCLKTKWNYKIIFPWIACEVNQKINIFYHIPVLQVTYLSVLAILFMSVGPTCTINMHVDSKHLSIFLTMFWCKTQRNHLMLWLALNSEGLPQRKLQSLFIYPLLFSHLFSLIFQLARHSVLWPRLLSLKNSYFSSLLASYQRPYCKNQYIDLDITGP